MKICDPTRNRILILTLRKNTDLLLGRRLMESGYDVIHLDGWRDAAVPVFRTPPEMALLDIALEELSLFDAITKAREVFRGPLIALADAYDESDHILALELGADDFMARPFNFLLLSAKIDALLRMSGSAGNGAGATTIVVGGLRIDAARRDVYLYGHAVRLTTVEFDLLWYLARNAGTAVSRNDIQRTVFMLEYNGIERSIDMYISRLRRRLGDDPSEPRMLKTVRGTGYLFCGMEPAGRFTRSGMI